MGKKFIPTENQIQQVRNLYNAGISCKEMCHTLSMSKLNIKSIWKILGVYNTNRPKPRRIHLLTIKQCKSCQLTKNISEFRSQNRKSPCGGFTLLIDPHCKPCRLIKNKEYNHKNLEKTRSYYKKSKNKLRVKQNAQRTYRYNNDPCYKLRKRISRVIYGYLKLNSSKKTGSCVNYLQYTIAELKAHLESLFEPWMNWKNHGPYNKSIWNDNDSSTWTWQIDHIIPQSNLPYASMEDDNFKKCWALSNLRPYSAKQNILDSNRKINILFDI